MSFSLTIIFNLSICIAAVIGLIRFGKIYRSYQPFIFITVAGTLSEVVSIISVRLYHTNALIYNLFSIIECILWFWQFRRWKVQKTSILNGLLGCLVAVWIVEYLVLSKILTFSAVFSIAYSFCLVFIAISQVNRLIVEESKSLLVNSKFLICSGIIIFYTYRILGESFYLFELYQSNSFMSNITYIVVFVNLFVNLLYALATIWIPTRQRFTLPS